MHYVARGREPEGLEPYRDKYTPGWVEHYERQTRPKPTDSYWREFREHLGNAFSHLCGYCEASCKGEADHFRPKSRFPEHVYQWSNWVFACHDCNQSKGEKWPTDGYVDPCARIRSSRPEQFFDFDVKTGEIIPKAGLTRRRWEKATRMIDDLKLNAHHHLRRRLLWIAMVSKVLKGEYEDDPGHADFVERVTARDCPLSSVARSFLAQKGYFED